MNDTSMVVKETRLTRQCSICGEMFTRIDQSAVGRLGRQLGLCVECYAARGDALVERNRRAPWMNEPLVRRQTE